MDMVAVRKVKLEPLPKPAKKAKVPKPKKSKKVKPQQPSLFDSQAEEIVSPNGKPTADPIQPKTRASKTKKPSQADERRRVEDAIKNEVLKTLSQRADRFLQVQGAVLVPDRPFAAPSMECAEQFRDGHYFGCIALTQTLVEAVILHVWQVKLKKKPNQEGSFEKNLAVLHKKKIISDEWKSKLDQVWSERHSFHHLRPSVKSDQKQLEESARNTLLLLNDLEQEFFGFELAEVTN